MDAGWSDLPALPTTHTPHPTCTQELHNLMAILCLLRCFQTSDFLNQSSRWLFTRMCSILPHLSSGCKCDWLGGPSYSQVSWMSKLNRCDTSQVTENSASRVRTIAYSLSYQCLHRTRDAQNKPFSLSLCMYVCVCVYIYIYIYIYIHTHTYFCVCTYTHNLQMCIMFCWEILPK